MNKIKISKNNYDKFIFKGALALESYFDDRKDNLELFDKINKKITNYRSLKEKNNDDKEVIVNDLLLAFEKLGQENFIIYEDGDVEYNYNKEEGDDFNL